MKAWGRLLFSPSIALMNQLGYRKKFLLIGLLSLIALSSITLNLYTALNPVIHTSYRELEGLSLAEQTSRVIQLLQKHRGLTQGLIGGNAFMYEEVVTSGNEIDIALAQTERKLPASFASRKDWRAIKLAWEQLKKKEIEHQSFMEHTDLIRQLQVFEMNIADEFMLTLDSEVGSHYLIDVSLNRLPDMLEHLGQLRGISTGILTRKFASENDRQQLENLIAETGNTLDLLQANLVRAGSYNPMMLDSLTQASRIISDAGHQIVSAVQNDILAGKYAIQPDAFFILATSAINNGYKQMYELLLPAANSLVNERLAKAKMALYTAIGLALANLLIVIYFLTGIYFSIIGSIRSLNRSAHAFARGSLHERAHLDTRDELGQMGNCFNEMADGFNELLAKFTEANELKQKTIASSLIGILAYHAKSGQCVLSNKTAAAIMGITEEQLLQQNFRQLESWKESGLLQVVQETLDHGADQNSEVHLHALDKEVWINILTTTFTSQGEQHLLLMFEDITKRKAAESKLYEAMEIADAASKAKGDFLASMSHEIRTPMNAITGLSQLCLQTDLTAKQLDYLKKIQGASKSLLGIINDVLDISKIEAGKLEIEQTAFYLGGVMENLATIGCVKAQEKGLECSIEILPDVPDHLIGDPLRLGQVLINLAGNAAKFTENGEIAIRVETEETASEYAILRFTVQDTGIGLTQEQIDKLFQSFTQAETATSRKFGGTGLGLSISKRLVELMGGRIWVESTPSVGSKFIFTARFQKPVQLHEKSYVPCANLQGMHILLASGCATSRRVIESLLRSFAFEVTAVGNAAKALEAIRQADMQGISYGLVIADRKMPDMDGIELAQSLHKMAAPGKKPKILLLTTYCPDSVLQQSMDVRVIDGVLPKPVMKKGLFNAVIELYEGVKERRGAPASLFDSSIVAAISGAHLLLVEDNEINQQIAQELLEKAGVTVTIAGNGEEALTCLREESFDGVLMDMQMPVMDGIAATREIRKNTQFEKLPVIAMTASAFAEDLKNCMAAGMNDYITKPLDPNKMMAVIAQWVKPSQRVALPAEAPSHAEPMPVLPGVNVIRGVSRLGGSVTSYCAILEKFCAEQRNIATVIREALDANDWKKAERLAHTLKGLAGTIGAERLQIKVRELERHIHELGMTQAKMLLPAVEADMSSLIAAIEKSLQLRTEEGVAIECGIVSAPVNPEELASLVRTAKTQLEQFDSSVDASMARLQKLVKNDPAMKTSLDAIQRCISNYDYEQGLGRLNNWAKSTGIAS